MARTLSAPDGDLDFRIAKGLDALRQRVVQALRFRRGEYFLDTRLGVPYFADVLGHQFDDVLAEQAITSAILAVDGVTGVSDVKLSLDREQRHLRVSVTVRSIYGDSAMEAAV